MSLGESEGHREVEWVSKKKIKAFAYCSIFLHVSSLRILAHFHHIMSFPATLAKKPKHRNDLSCALSQSGMNYHEVRSWRFGRVHVISIRQSNTTTEVTTSSWLWLRWKCLKDGSILQQASFDGKLSATIVSLTHCEALSVLLQGKWVIFFSNIITVIQIPAWSTGSHLV